MRCMMYKNLKYDVVVVGGGPAGAVAAIAAGVVPPMTGEIIDAFTGVSGYGVSYLIAVGLSVVYIIATIIYANWYNRTKKRS